jgi:hypothetical protein
LTKSRQKDIVKRTDPSAEEFKQNDYIFLGILFLFWIVFFRELLTGSAYLFDDFIEQYYPGKFMASVMLSKGIFPFWNPYIFSGMPFFADLQIAVMYPFNFILALFVKNDKLSALAIQNSIIFHYLIASVFSYFLARKLNIQGIFALLFAVLFTYSSYMIVHMIHMPLVEAVVWFPAVLFLWLKFGETKNFIYPILAGLSMAVCILAGYPQVPFFNFFFLAVYILFTVYFSFKSGNKNEIIHLAAGFLIIGILALGLTAFQLLPSLEFIGLSNRATFDYNFAKQGSMHIYDYVTLIIPKYFGVWSGNDKIGDIQYWSKHQEGPWMFSIATVFMSVLILVIFYPSLKYFIKEKKNPVLLYTSVFIIVFSFLFSLGGNFFFHKLVYDFVPFFNRFRNPAHVVYIAMTSILMISFAGLNGIVSDKKVKEYFSGKYFITILSVSFLLLLYIITGSAIPDYAVKVTQVTSYVSKQAYIFFVFFIIYAALFYYFANGKLKFRIFGYSLIFILFFEIYFIWFEQNNGTRNPEQVFNQRPQLSERFKQEMKTDNFRVNMREGGYMLLQRNQGFIDNVEYLEGYGALMLKNFIPPNKSNPESSQTHDLMNVKYKIMTDSAGKKYLGLNGGYLPRAKMYYDAVKFNSEDDVKNYMSSSGFDFRKTLAIEDKDEIVLPKSAPGDSILPINSVKITEYALNSIKIEVDSEADGLLYLSEVYYPAWSAYVDENKVKILKTDFCMRSVPVIKGKHTVEFKYESDTFATGLKITMLTSILFIISIPLAILIHRKQKKRKSDENPG